MPAIDLHIDGWLTALDGIFATFTDSAGPWTKMFIGFALALGLFGIVVFLTSGHD